MRETTPDTLLEQHAGLVRSAVGWALRRIDGTQCVIDGDDLAQHARIILLEAHRDFNGQGDFGPFATQRMRWRLLDVIREHGPAERGHYRQIKAGLLPAICRTAINGDGTYGNGKANGERRELVAPGGDDPLAGIERERLRRLIAQLPPRLRTVMFDHTYHGRTMKAIGQDLGVNESRVSQLHSAALKQLRALAAGEAVPAAPPPRESQRHLEIFARLDRLEKASASDARRLSAIEARLVALESRLEHVAAYGETVSILQAAKICGVARRTIHKWVTDRKVRYVRTASGTVRIFRTSLFRSDEDASR